MVVHNLQVHKLQSLKQSRDYKPSGNARPGHHKASSTSAIESSYHHNNAPPTGAGEGLNVGYLFFLILVLLAAFEVIRPFL